MGWPANRCGELVENGQTDAGKLRSNRLTAMLAPTIALLLEVLTVAPPLRVAAAVVIAVSLAVVSWRRDV
jgi:hypothetical protein